MTKDMCDVTIVHEETVDAVQQKLPDLQGMVKIFKALADETRLKTAYSLIAEPELCVCDVAAIIGSSSATASHHLRYLRDKGLAKSSRKGKMIYYSLADAHVFQLITIAHEHALEEGDQHG